MDACTLTPPPLCRSGRCGSRLGWIKIVTTRIKLLPLTKKYTAAVAEGDAREGLAFGREFIKKAVEGRVVGSLHNVDELVQERSLDGFKGQEGIRATSGSQPYVDSLARIHIEPEQVGALLGVKFTQLSNLRNAS